MKIVFYQMPNNTFIAKKFATTLLIYPVTE